MKAIQVHQYGHAETMALEEVNQPEIEKGKILVKVHDAGVNPVDWKIREGHMRNYNPMSFPYTMGQDFSGEVVEVGEGVTGFNKGDHVFGFAQGSYAEYAIATPEELAHIPDTVDDIAAAAIPTAGLSAWQLINDVAKVTNTHTVLIHGAGGGVGSFALQFAKNNRATVIATASNEDFSYLRERGTDLLIDYKTEHFENIVKDIDIVIDLVGGETLARSYQVVKKDGLVVTTVGPASEEEAEKYGARVIQFSMRRDPDELEKLGHLVENGTIKPRISKVMNLSDARDADNLSQLGHPHGKVVLHVA